MKQKFKNRMTFVKLWLVVIMIVSANLSAFSKTVATSDEEVTLSNPTQTILKGMVVDKDGMPIAGANILEVGTKNGTITDFDGNFTLKLTTPNPKIKVTYMGFKDKTVSVKGKTEIRIVMADDTEALEEVVVTAFSTQQKKASVVGSIQVVKPKELAIPTANLSAGFAGKLSGVIAVQRSGQPGADGANFWIRGISSVNATNPLIILDGVEISSGDLNTIDPEIIAGFSILKDATATALYGSRGANGVVIVTTKNGADLDKPIINFRAETYVTTPTKLPEFVDGPEYMRLFNEAIGNLSTGDAPYSQEKINGTINRLNPYVYPNVRWYDELFTEQAINEKANFNIRGGGKKVDYFMSVTFDHQTGMLKKRSREFASFDNSLDVKRFAFQNNLRARFTETSELSLRLNAQMGTQRRPTTKIDDIFGAIMNTNPVDFPITYPSDGIITHTKWGTKKIGPAAIDNPFGKAVSGYADNFNSTIIANLEFKQDLDVVTEGLKFTALASFKNWASTTTKRSRNLNQYELVDYTSNYDLELNRIGDEQSTTLGSSGDNGGDRSFYLQFMGLWNREFGDHNLSAMVNYNQSEYSTNIAGDEILKNLVKRRQNIAGRLTYDYAGRYLIETNFGYNGSENFAEGKRFGFFPSVAVGYNVSAEPFWEPIKPVISRFKIRGSYGLVGNDRIKGDRFVYLADVQLQDNDRKFTTGINQDYELKGVKIKRFGNPDVSWETGIKSNIGVDFTFFDDLNLSIDVFKENRKDIFIERGVIPLYMGTGDTKLFGNLAEIDNKGLDIALDYNKRVNEDLDVSFRGTFTFARNKVVKWDEPELEYPQLSKVGHRLNMYEGYVADRLFIDANDVKNNPEQKISTPVEAGDIKYMDLPNRYGEYNGVIDSNDRQFIGDPQIPEIVYGFGPSVRYKNFDFGFFFQGVANTSIMLGGFHPFGTQYNRNVLKYVADNRWNPNNQNIYAKYPRLTKMDHSNNTQNSTYWLRDGAFLKLKNVEIAYNFLGNMRVYLRGMNLLTFSKFDLWDPEMGGGNGLKYPTQRTISVGFQMVIK
ncbi:MAG: TonB-dependent receptor [Flavobacteriaceae bacterium]|nr:TonB-dependent receptor [Flavobacteriaceae bacterium]